MIRIGDKEIDAISVGERAVAFVYEGIRLVWQKVKEALSCFGRGYWVNEDPWLNDDAWMN